MVVAVRMVLCLGADLFLLRRSSRHIHGAPPYTKQNWEQGCRKLILHRLQWLLVQALKVVYLQGRQWDCCSRGRLWVGSEAVWDRLRCRCYCRNSEGGRASLSSGGQQSLLRCRRLLA